MLVTGSKTTPPRGRSLLPRHPERQRLCAAPTSDLRDRFRRTIPAIALCRRLAMATGALRFGRTQRHCGLSGERRTSSSSSSSSSSNPRTARRGDRHRWNACPPPSAAAAAACPSRFRVAVRRRRALPGAPFNDAGEGAVFVSSTCPGAARLASHQRRLSPPPPLRALFTASVVHALRDATRAEAREAAFRTKSGIRLSAPFFAQCLLHGSGERGTETIRFQHS